MACIPMDAKIHKKSEHVCIDLTLDNLECLNEKKWLTSNQLCIKLLLLITVY